MFRSKHRSALILAVLLIAAAPMLGYIAAVAANPVGALPDAKDHGAGELKIKPEKHNFGQVTEFTNSAPLILRTTNHSKSASIIFTSVVASAPFMIQSNGCTGALDAGNFCEVKVVFSPVEVGGVSDQQALTFTDSAKNSPQHIALKGFGIPTRMPPSPTATPTMTPTPSPSPSGSLTPTASPTLTMTPTTTISATPTTPTMTPTPSPSPTPTRTNTATCTTQATPAIAGRVLIAGGQGSDGTPLNTAEVFNPVTNTFTLTTALGGSNMTDARYSHAAAATSTTSAFASVTVTGGIDANGATDSTETFSSITNKFTAGGNMTDSRQGHTATFLVMPAGVLLVTGGRDANGTVLKSADIYTLPFDEYATSTMNTARVNAAAAGEQFYTHVGCYSSETALITGGSDGMNALQTAEVFDTSTDAFTLTDQLGGGSQMNAPRVFHTATLYSGGILVAGGQGAAGVAQASAEVFDLATNKFTLTTGLGGTNMTVARAMHTATLISISPNQVLIAGGIDSSGNALASAEVFNPTTNSFTAVGSMHSARFNHAAAHLPNGDVLITGGEDGSGNTLNTAEIYDPGTQTFTLTTDASLGGNNMNAARKLHTATAY